jgi:hypothetical protein
MTLGERDALRKGLREKALQAALKFDPESIRGLQSELFALDALFKTGSKVGGARARPALDRTIDLAGTAHAFTAELRGFLGQKQHSETASWFDLSSIGILAIENVMTADKITLPRILMSALSEALMFLASRQYVAGSGEVLRGLYRQHASHMYRELWALATDHRKGMTAKDVREIQAAIDAFFGRLEAEGVAPEARIAVLREFYALLLVLRAVDLSDALGG